MTEGLNEFELADISAIASGVLGNHDVVLLGQVPLTSSQVITLSNWVSAGGKLIAMRPDEQLAELLGLVGAGSTLSEGYLLTNTDSGPGVGIVAQTIQFHGTADRYTLGDAASVATLYSDAQTPTANPAVTLRNVGGNGGQAAAFTFDLAQSVVFTRQGNPAWSGQARDGVSPIRPDDLFYGAASFDPKPDWVDFSKISIPQADEQQRLLANLIVIMEASKNLLPRFWYFPHGYRAVVVMTGDDHGSGGTAGRFDHYAALSPPGSTVEDWTAIRGTSYAYSSTPLGDAQVAAYNAAGFEIALHPETGCSDYTRASFDSMLTTESAGFKAAFPSLPAPTTQRIHCIAWSEFSMPAEVSLLHGIRLETSYYYWPSGWVADRPGLFTGSGMPMRFATAQGAILDIFQAVTQMTDESGQTYPYTVDTLLDLALGPQGYYGAFVANMHADSASSPGSDAIVSSAMSRGVPVVSARQLLTWLDARNGSVIKSVHWTGSSQTFTVEANPSTRGIQVMVPVPSGYDVSQVKYNGASLQYSSQVIKGLSYVVFPASSGDYEVTYVAQ